MVSDERDGRGGVCDGLGGEVTACGFGSQAWAVFRAKASAA